MAYVDQDRKKRIEALCKPIFKKYGIKARLGVHHHTELVCNISAGTIDFNDPSNWSIRQNEYDEASNQKIRFDGHLQVNHYHYDHHYAGRALEFFSELIPALQSENFDKSDIQSDYFHVGYYLSVNVGKWDKPYELVKE